MNKHEEIIQRMRKNRKAIDAEEVRIIRKHRTRKLLNLYHEFSGLIAEEIHLLKDKK